MLSEIQAMAKYAFAAGLKVPEDLMVGLSGLLELSQVDSAQLRKQKGSKGWKRSLDKEGKLTQIHNRLAEIVAPAKPSAILVLEEEAQKNSFWHFLGSVPLVRRLMGISILCILLLLGMSLSREVNESLQDQAILNTAGWPLLINLLFTLSAAGVGASFSLLFSASRYVKNSTFDPRYESFYWVRFVLGLISGAILAEILSHNIDLGENIPPKFVKVVCAILGGFSAQAVYDILNRLAQTVETLLGGSEAAALAKAEPERIRAEGGGGLGLPGTEPVTTERSYLAQVTRLTRTRRRASKKEDSSQWPTMG